MKRFSLRPALLVAVVFLAAWPVRAAVPLKDVTEEKLRTWTGKALKASRDDPARADFWKELDALIVVDPDSLVYEHDKGVPTKLLWQCKPKRNLDDTERDKAVKMLRKFYDYAIFEHDKGFLTAEEAKKLDAVAHLEIGPNPAPPVADTTVPLKDVTQDKLRAWTGKALKASRNDPAKADFWKELDAFIVVDPDKIIYEQEKGVPVRVFWECKPKRNLDGSERNKALKMLRQFYNYATLEHDKGLLSAADAKLLDVVTHLEVAPNGGNPRKHPAVVPTTPVKEVTQETVQDWIVVAIEATRKDPAWIEIWKELDDALVIDPDEMIYEHDKGVPVKLIWHIKPRHALTAEERLKVQADLQKLVQYMLFEYNKGLVPAEDMEVIKTVVHVDLDTGSTATKVGDNSEEMEKLRKEIADFRTEIDKLKKDQVDGQTIIEQIRKDIGSFRSEIDEVRKELVKIRVEIDVKAQAGNRTPGKEGQSNPQNPNGTSAPRGYIMVVQPSSMIYYDCWSHCWLPGPASVVYYPASSAEAPKLPRAPAFMPPVPTPIPPPVPQPKGPEKVPEQSANPEEAGRVFWVGYRSYWQGDFDRALTSFDSAVRLDREDARFWYYKALAERALGDAVKAEESARRGRELHAAQKPKADLVGAALERVQGQERRFLNAPEVLVSDAKDDR